MFAFPLGQTCELLVEQLQQARQMGNAKVKVRCSAPQLQLILIKAKYVFMVGGFAESPYMYRKIKKLAAAHGVDAIRPAYAYAPLAPFWQH